MLYCIRKYLLFAVRSKEKQKYSLWSKAKILNFTVGGARIKLDFKGIREIIKITHTT
jgi:chemotaxis signal transduction protein